jgi:hypothetical protein
MRSYNSLLEAVNDLKKRGYTQDFSLKENGVCCVDLNIELHPEDFNVEEYYRFEGMSNPSDNSVVYAINSNKGVKGVLIDAYGMYSENVTPEMTKKLTVSHDF